MKSPPTYEATREHFRDLREQAGPFVAEFSEGLSTTLAMREFVALAESPLTAVSFEGPPEYVDRMRHLWRMLVDHCEVQDALLFETAGEEEE